MSIISMCHEETTTVAAAAMVDVQLDGRITGVSWSIMGTGGAGVGKCIGEMSFGSSSAVLNNDARQIIDTIGASFGNAATGSMNKFTAMDIPVAAGDRIYLHLTAQGTALASLLTCAHIHIQDKAGRVTRMRA